MRVVPIPALADNYEYACVDAAASRVALVDPGEAAAARELFAAERFDLSAILLTHHHADHVGGVDELARFFPGARIVGAEGDRQRLPRLTASVREGQEVDVLDGLRARVIEVPGHTLGHVAYFVPDGTDAGDLFSGDTVFGGTIGNLFEGTPDVMFESLVKLRALPRATRIWCGHEYTLQYVREAARFDPSNARLAQRLARVEAEAASGRPSVPLVLEEECATNPFFRWDDPQLVRRLGTAAGLPTFRRLCELL